MTLDDRNEPVAPIDTGDDEPELLQLARKHFERLAKEREKEADEAKKWYPAVTESEEKLIRKSAAGEWADYTELHADFPSPGDSEKWPDTATIRAEVVTWLCTNKKSKELMTTSGLRITGARIRNGLDFTETDVPFGIYFFGCCLDGDAILRRAQIRGLYFLSTQVAGIYADGVRITDGLYLRDGFVCKGCTNLIGATIGGNFDCSNAVFLHESTDGTPSLDFSSAKIQGNVFLRNGFESKGQVIGTGAEIGGVLECGHARFLFESSIGATCLELAGAKIKGNVYLWEEFVSQGQTSLLGAEIGGDINCRNGHFLRDSADGMPSLNLNSARISHNVFLIDGFESSGQVDFKSAEIGGVLDCSKGMFQFVGSEAIPALDINSAKIHGNVFLRNGFESKGQVSLICAEIGGVLECTDAKFLYESYDGSPSLNISSARIGGSVFLGNRFLSKGQVSFVAAEISGDLYCAGGQFTEPLGVQVVLNANSIKIRGSMYLRENAEFRGEINLINADIKGFFEWRSVILGPHASLRLESASVRTLYDDPTCWPGPGKLELHGFTYDEIYKDSPTDAAQRLDWLSRQPQTHFNSQPFEQLAAVLNKQGHEREARKVRIAKERERARLIKMRPWQHFFHRLTGITIAYGHRPWQAMWWIVSFLALGYVLFWTAHSYELMVPSTSWAYADSDLGGIGGAGTKCLRDNYPAFQPFIYSLDEFAPLVNLRQGDYWIPNANGGETIGFAPKWLTTGRLISWYLYFHIIAGWTLTTLLVAGLSGLVRR